MVISCSPTEKNKDQNPFLLISTHLTDFHRLIKLRQHISFLLMKEVLKNKRQK
jgi:hypothetical protein